MTNVSFDRNRRSGERNAPMLLGGGCEPHAAAPRRLAPAPCGTRLLEMLRWISPVRSGRGLVLLILAQSVSGALPAACRAFPGSLLLPPGASLGGGLWMGANRKEVYL